MHFHAALVLLASALSVSSAAVLARDSKSEWRDYDMVTKQLADRGLCRLYLEKQPSYSSWKEQCEPLCADARAVALDKDEFFNVACLPGKAGGHVETFRDPEARAYTYGECKCNLAVINEGTKKVFEKLPAIGLIACSVWKLAAKEALDIAGAVVGVSRAKTGTQALAKAAKQIKKQGGGENDWEEWVEKHLKEGTACDFSLKQLFHDFTGLDDSAIKNV